MKRTTFLISTILLLLLSASALFAQSATPEATPPQAQSIGELLASLPQSRQADGGFVAGDDSAPITVIEFMDYACSHCQDYRPTMDQVIEQYVATGKAKFELRILPTTGGDVTRYAAQLAECANHQRLGDYWRAYDLLYTYVKAGQYNDQMGPSFAADLNLKYDKLDHCTQTAARQVDRDGDLATRLSVLGTPSVLVRYLDGDPQFITASGQTYSAGGVPFDVLAQVIDSAQPIIN
ncbi:MAG TPA: thioredoxin domain-containing protein [Phototrophicaceae bacterium]|nr:thioredoxin domain-containing protein [Phototrophicaceae bacterium]